MKHNKNMPKPEKELIRLQEIIIALRKPDGCPWDKKQTPQSFKSYLIEEVHELIEALDCNDPQSIKEELGDLMFQLLFLNQLFEEQGAFTLGEVIATISEKMINRHPHVFSEKEILSEEEQSLKWNKIKAAEKQTDKTIADLIKNVPKSLPGLRRAQRVSERAASNGFEWKNISACFTKLEEEVDELKEAIANGKKHEISEEIGDCLFVLTNLGRLTKVNTEDSLHTTVEKFITRFSLLEKKVTDSKRTIADMRYEDLVNLWQLVKNELTEKP